MTGGIGLIAGVIVDQIVDKIWNWFADPHGKLVADINKKLDEMNGAIKVILRTELQAFAQQRAPDRRKAIIVLHIMQTQGPSR